MKKTLLFISALITGITGYSQIETAVPNGGFESWNNNQLDNWSDTTQFSTSGSYSLGPFNLLTVDTVVNSPQTGNYSVAVHSIVYSGRNLPGISVSGANAKVGIVQPVDVSFNPTGAPSIVMEGRIPFVTGAKSPKGLKGYYKYRSDSTISGSISVILFGNNGDTVGAYINTVASNTLNAGSYELTPQSNWTAFNFNFSGYFLGGYTSIPSQIDSARIVILTCLPGQLQKSSAKDTVFLDKLEFTYAPNAIESLDDSGFGVSQNAPNPTNGSTAIEVITPNAGTITLTVVDILGTVVSEQKIAATSGSNIITYDGSATPSGTYFYTVSNGSSSVTKKLVIAK